MDVEHEATYETWAEVVYLLVARYDMPDPTGVANDFIQHVRDHGGEVPAIAAIRQHVDSDRLDLAAVAGGRKSADEIRRYFHELLRCYDRLEPRAAASRRATTAARKPESR